MRQQVLKGTKQEIAESILRISGEVREAVVTIDEPAQDAVPPGPDENILAEMEPYMVKAGGADYSREAIYSRTEGE